ncbi:MAG: adenosine monophosphate-protein transferase [Euryarchaeota archaeon RBG_16_68_12]|nr:MAG: adenosine monophosphate-protein transferase [Euryarchaeota archaeon RBG_16_68_12]
MVEFKSIPVKNPEGLNVVIGQTHFIKTAEDLYEAVANSVPQAKFGVAFCEASGPCLVRVEGNDAGLKDLASTNALAIGAGHTFVMFLRDAYPVNVLRAIRDTPEVVTIFCATSNPVDVLVAENPRGRGVVGVIDGERPKGVETEADRRHRMEFLRRIGYKLG